MKKKIYDIECYKNYFCVGIKDYSTKEIIFYEISEERNDLDLIYKWFKEYNGFLISFNGLHYDNMIIKYLLNNYKNYKNWDKYNVLADLKYFSDKIITSDVYDDEIKTIKYLRVNWTDIDLFSYWSKMLRISKKISLKSLAIQLGYSVVQELPYKPDTILKLEDLPKLRTYNTVHDLGITELLTDAMYEEIKLRANIVSEYKLNCWSWDAPKIASEALLQDYCRITGKKVKDVRNQRFEKPTLYLDRLLKGFNPEFKLPIFQKLWLDICNSQNSFSQELLVNQANTSIRLSYGIGGLHSVNENETYVSNNDTQVITSDVASLYPNLMINYHCLRYKEVLERYIEVKTERLIAKKAKDKAKDTFLKLILNSTSGLIDNQHSWLYFPEGAMRLRLIGQLILTKCIEECILNNWQVVSANTDGIEVIVPKNELNKYKELLDNTCRLFNLDLEHENYSKIVYKNVNNYIAVTEDGKYKQKGLFVPKPILGNSVDELVIAKALEAYYTKDIQPREFISNPDKYDLHIYDYCKSNKIGKDFTVYHNSEIQQQLNRYYFSKKGAYLFKQKKSNIYSESDRNRLTQEIINNDGANGAGYAPNWKPLTSEQIKIQVDKLIYGNATMQHVNVGNAVILFNNYEEKSWKDYNVNYNYYIASTQKIIDEIANFNQLVLF